MSSGTYHGVGFLLTYTDNPAELLSKTAGFYPADVTFHPHGPAGLPGFSAGGDVWQAFIRPQRTFTQVAVLTADNPGSGQ
jgi:hypothetical protein